MVIIAYEGKSDGEFFDSLLEEYKLSKNEVIYYDFQGKDNLFNISHSYYDEIEKMQNKLDAMLLVVDADNKKDPNPNRGYEASEQKIKELIENLEFNMPIDYYIMCDEKQEGYLESFLLSVLNNEQKKCIESFKKCFQYELIDKWVYNSFYKHNKYPFDFSHENFTTLKQKLQDLFS